jgi:hypothetical protein
MDKVLRVREKDYAAIFMMYLLYLDEFLVHLRKAVSFCSYRSETVKQELRIHSRGADPCSSLNWARRVRRNTVLRQATACSPKDQLQLMITKPTAAYYCTSETLNEPIHKSERNHNQAAWPFKKRIIARHENAGEPCRDVFWFGAEGHRGGRANWDPSSRFVHEMNQSKICCRTRGRIRHGRPANQLNSQCISGMVRWSSSL